MSRFVAKSSLTVDGNNVHLSIPFTKGSIDKDKRTVSGYATLDNVDSQGDVVTAEASLKAFSRARGNLREMHDKVAVGRVVDFREDEFFDNGEFYRGIFVTAYVSEGAPNTWAKVLDGTLSGFSIGGEINDASSEFVKEAGRTVRFIKDYDLVELSLVDNPANQLANILSITKSAEGSVTLKGMATEVVVESVFMCKHAEDDGGDIIVVKGEEEVKCPSCGNKMENIGWFESGDDRAEKVQTIVAKHLKPSFTKEAAPEGGVEMAKSKEEAANVPDDGTAPRAVDATDPAAEELSDRDPQEVEKPAEENIEGESADVDEVEDDEEEVISKKIDELKTVIHEALETSNKDTGERITALEKKIDEVRETFDNKASELEGKFSEFGKELTAAKAHVAELEKNLEAVNKSAAVKKSADVESAEPVQKSGTAKWGKGTFSGTTLFS
jgi:phage head maturation protease